MPKANLKVLRSVNGPFTHGKCSLCAEEFTSMKRGPDAKRDMLLQFEAHRNNRHWKRAAGTKGSSTPNAQ